MSILDITSTKYIIQVYISKMMGSYKINVKFKWKRHKQYFFFYFNDDPTILFSQNIYI